MRDAEWVMVLTGAGVSRESGIPTFRDAQEGLWADFDPQKLATVEGYLADPALVWSWYDMRRLKVGQAQPNPGHYALVALEKEVPHFFLVTQNIDGLHRRAGSQNVVELHGNIARHKCFDGGHAPQQELPYGLTEPPQCQQCGSMIRPDVVWFGEALPTRELRVAFAAAEKCEVALVVGTSALVQPAAALPLIAKERGAMLIEVNPDETDLTEFSDIYLPGKSGDVLPQLIDTLKVL